MNKKLALSFQTLLPEDYAENRAFHSPLTAMRGMGFWGIELNIADPWGCSPKTLRSFLARYGLELSMLATGVTAKRLGLSLSHPEESVRRRSVTACKQMIDWAAGTEAGIIVGFLKGGVAAEKAEARARFRLSLEEIAAHAAGRAVPILIEATNRYESSVANSLDDTVDLLKGLDAEHAFVLPDTFHMNIEEADMLASLARCRGRFMSVHLSDNNRFFPGFGSIDFARVIKALREAGFDGRLAIEGNVSGELEGDLRKSMETLSPLLLP